MNKDQEQESPGGIINYKEKDEKISIGTIVSNLAHPYTVSNSKVLITTYAHFTPPLMIIVEKKYGIPYNAISGEKEDNDSYKCLYYSTINGAFELNWFKLKEIKVIKEKDNLFFVSNKEKPVDQLKKELFGKMVILTNVDLELEKTKIWAETNGQVSKMKRNNLLDFIPPLGSIIDVKLNEDYQKYNEKNGKISHRKSKLLIKVRWLNNITSKYSEEYIPLVALKEIENNLKEFKKDKVYIHNNPFELEEGTTVSVKSIPLKFEDVIWKHYYYVYSFKNLFTQELVSIKEDALSKINELKTEECKIIFDNSFKYTAIYNFFKAENKAAFEQKWFEIHYADKSEKYSKRIIFIKEFIEEDLVDEPGKKHILIKANCLLRDGKIRHFNVKRIKGYKALPNNFETIFVKKK